GMTGAVGGTREIRAPDEVARDYLLLALRLDQHEPGLVDGYFGPAELKAQVDLEQLRPPERLVDDASGLLDRIPGAVAEPDRRQWLIDQTIALRTHAERLAGGDLGYLHLGTRFFARAPGARDEHVFDAAAAEIHRILPGDDPVADRLAEWDRRFTIPIERL